MLISPENNLPELSTLRSLFMMMDKNLTGFIDLHKLEQVMNSHNIHFSKKQMESFKKFAKITEEYFIYFLKIRHIKKINLLSNKKIFCDKDYLILINIVYLLLKKLFDLLLIKTISLSF